MCSKSLRWKGGVGEHLGVFPDSGELCKVGGRTERSPANACLAV